MNTEGQQCFDPKCKRVNTNPNQYFCASCGINLCPRFHVMLRAVKRPKQTANKKRIGRALNRSQSLAMTSGKGSGTDR